MNQPVAREIGGAQSVDRALALLSLISRHAGGVALSEVVEESGLNRATARRLLLALMRSRLVEQDPVSRRYHLGEESFVLGVLASRRYGLLDVAMESLIALSARSGDTSFLSVRRDTFAVCLHREEGAYPIRTHALEVGDRHPLGVGGGSLAILAALPDAEIDRVLAANNAIVSADYPLYSSDIIREHVALARERGWVVNPGLVLPNSWAVARVVRYPDGRVAGALSLSAIDSRMGEARQRELAALIGSEVQAVEARLRRMFAPAGDERAVPRGGSGRTQATLQAGRRAGLAGSDSGTAVARIEPERIRQ
ncbi:IclR family transcriptional regulator [Aurantimonas sp. A2-1-M11]